MIAFKPLGFPRLLKEKEAPGSSLAEWPTFITSITIIIIMIMISIINHHHGSDDQRQESSLAEILSLIKLLVIFALL